MPWVNRPPQPSGLKGRQNDSAQEAAGYRAAFLSQAGRIVPSSPRFALPRLSLHDGPVEELARRLAEIFDPVGFLFRSPLEGSVCLRKF